MTAVFAIALALIFGTIQHKLTGGYMHEQLSDDPDPKRIVLQTPPRKKKKGSALELVVGIILVAMIFALGWRTLAPSEIIIGAAHQRALQGK